MWVNTHQGTLAARGNAGAWTFQLDESTTAIARPKDIAQNLYKCQDRPILPSSRNLTLYILS